jgi:glycogen(starch) synthase
MKVLLVSSSFFPKIDGSTRCVYDHGRKLAALGAYVCLVTRGIEGTKREENVEGINVLRSSYSFRGGSLWDRMRLMVEQARTIMRLQRKERFNVIHAHGFTSGLAALPSRYILGVPLVITTHGTELLWPRKLRWKAPSEIKLIYWFERFVLNHCDVVVAQSEGVKNYMLQIYGSQLREKIKIVPTGVDHEKFMVRPKRDGPTQVLFVGALSEIKGLSVLIRAFADVRKELPEMKLALVGSGPRAPEYKKLVHEMNLDGSVHFSGPVRDDARLLQFYADSDIVVLPSNVGGPISCTIMEGLSCG